MGVHDSLYWENLPKPIQNSTLLVDRIRQTKRTLHKKTQMPHTQLTRADWGCHGSEALAIRFINFTDEIFEGARKVALILLINTSSYF
jgi:hypothetical protein